MSRPKGSGKLAWGKAHPADEILTAALGKDSEMTRSVRAWREILKRLDALKIESVKVFRSDIPAPAKGRAWILGDPKAPLEYFVKREMVALAEIVENSIRTGDGSVLRAMADAVEAPQSGHAHQVKTWLIARLFDPSGKAREQREKVPLATLQRELEARGIRIAQQHLREHCRELGIELPGKTGRPRENKSHP